MTVLFSDNFDRADGDPDNNWTANVGTWTIESNTLKCVPNSNGYGNYRHVFTDSNNIIVSGKVKADTTHLEGDTSNAYITVLASNDFGDNMANDAMGLGLLFYDWISGPGYGSYVAFIDNGSTLGYTAFTFTDDTWYDFEYTIYSDYSIDIYVWESSGAKPGTPTLQIGAFTPSASKGYTRLGIKSKGSTGMYFDEFEIYTIPGVKEFINVFDVDPIIQLDFIDEFDVEPVVQLDFIGEFDIIYGDIVFVSKFDLPTDINFISEFDINIQHEFISMYSNQHEQAAYILVNIFSPSTTNSWYSNNGGNY